MNTHDKYELPPLPHGLPTYEFPEGSYAPEQMQDYARAAIEADRARQGDAAKVLAELVALIPLADTPNASASCRDLIDYFNGLIADRQRRGEPDWEAIKGKRMCDLSASQQEDARELWLREQWRWFGEGESRPGDHIKFLLDRLDALRAPQPAERSRGEPVDVPDALRKMARWMDDGGPSKHEAELIGMDLAVPVECSSHRANPAAPQPAEPVSQHPDDAAVDAFAATMKAKLAKKRAEGRGGWRMCSAGYLSRLLREHVEKGDPVDVANLAMMLSQNGQRIEATEPMKVPSDDEIIELRSEFDWREHHGNIRFARALLARYGQPAEPVKVPSDAKEALLEAYRALRELEKEIVLDVNQISGAAAANFAANRVLAMLARYGKGQR